MKWVVVVLNIFIILIGIASAENVFASTQNIESNYLLPPTGVYGIGYQDITLVNPQLCPDKLYVKHVNESDFSPENDQHCHEMMLRVYYPTTHLLKTNQDYYRPFLAAEIAFYQHQFHLSQSQTKLLNVLYEIKTDEQKDASIAGHQKFPVLIFVPGSGVPVQAYTNLIDHLVSQGFVVLGLNSVFANGPIQLPNGHVVPRPTPYNDATRLENLADLNFVLKELPNLKYRKPLKNAMDFSQVGLLGHSMGAMNIVAVVKENKQPFPIQAIVLMDPGNIKGRVNYPLPQFNYPSLVLWSSYFKHQMHGSMKLGKDGHEVVLSSGHSVGYSNHLNFTDLSTLQYHPAYQIQPIYQWITSPKNMGVGKENGIILASDINQEISNFLHKYLKNV